MLSGKKGKENGRDFGQRQSIGFKALHRLILFTHLELESEDNLLCQNRYNCKEANNCLFSTSACGVYFDFEICPGMGLNQWSLLYAWISDLVKQWAHYSQVNSLKWHTIYVLNKSMFKKYDVLEWYQTLWRYHMTYLCNVLSRWEAVVFNSRDIFPFPPTYIEVSFVGVHNAHIMLYLPA